VTVESDDIARLDAVAAGITASDVTAVHANLRSASEQHLAAFTRPLGSWCGTARAAARPRTNSTAGPRWLHVAPGTSTYQSREQPATNSNQKGAQTMNRLIAPVAGASLAALLAVGAASAATPSPSAVSGATPASAVTLGAAAANPNAAPAAGATSVLTEILGLSNAEIAAFRQQGLSLAQIAERQNVDPQKLIDALVAQWSARIEARLAAGAITADQAKTLEANVAVQAKSLVNQVAVGGMRGAAVGAGPNGAQRGAGAGGNAAVGNGPAAGAGRGAMMRGAGGAGACPTATTAPSS
jgi:hypothetical protein